MTLEKELENIEEKIIEFCFNYHNPQIAVDLYNTLYDTSRLLYGSACFEIDKEKYYQKQIQKKQWSYDSLIDFLGDKK